MKRIKQDLNTENGLNVFDVDVSVLETYSHIKLTTELTLNVTQTYFFITLEYFHMDGCSGKRMHRLCINV